MRNNKGKSIILVILTILILVLIGFLIYEIVYVDIFGIINKESSIEIDANVLVKTNSVSGSEISQTNQNVYANQEYTDLSNLYNDEQSYNSGHKYYYNQLDEYGKIIYDSFEQNKENMKSGTYTIDFGTQFSDLLNSENGENILNEAFQSAWNAYTYDNTDIFYIDVEKLTLTTRTMSNLGIHNVEISHGSNTSYLKRDFQNPEVLNGKLNLLEAMRKEIARQLEGYSDYEKVREVHNWLIENIDYDTNLEAMEPYSISGALTEGKAVCEGYARSFKYILDELNIPCALVSGTATNSNGDTESHAWNYVQLDGKWYGVDVTWDDPIILGNGYVSEETYYRYFLKGSNTFMQTHKEDGYLSQNSMEFTFPSLNAEEY